MMSEPNYFEVVAISVVIVDVVILIVVVHIVLWSIGMIES